jgi:hypothetical protein
MRQLIIVILVLLLAASSAAAADVTAVPSTTKVLKDGSFTGGADAVTLAAAKNEFEGFQIVIRAGGAGLQGVDVTISDLDGPGGAVIPAAAAERFLEYYVAIDAPSPCDIYGFNTDCASHPDTYLRTAGWYPDALVPFVDPYGDAHHPVAAPFDVPGDDLQTVFVDLHVPGDAVPGAYTGTVTVTAAGGTVATLPLGLTVWDFALPVERHVGTSYGMGLNLCSQYHGGPEGLSGAQKVLVERNYEWALHQHRVDFTTHKGPLTFAVDGEGTLLPVDFSEYDAYMAPRLDGSYYPDGAPLARFNVGAFRPGHGMMGLPEAAYAEAARVMAEHLQEKGWLDEAWLYASDEPWLPGHWDAYDNIAHDVALLHSQTDLWKGHVLVTGPWQETLDDAVDIWCPVTPMYGNTWWPEGSWAPKEKYAELLAAGRALWFYVCNANFPAFMGYDVDSRIGWEPRLVKWGAWREGATGFLYWRVSYWQSQDPWHVLVNLPQFGALYSRQGDGILLYPGDHDGTAGTGSPAHVQLDGPVVSYRLKQIRDGLEDWEMLLLAEQLGAGDWARAQVDGVYRAFGDTLTEDFDVADPPWSLDEAAVLAAREQVALKVQYLTHPELYEDPEDPASGPETPPTGETGPEPPAAGETGRMSSDSDGSETPPAVEQRFETIGGVDTAPGSAGSGSKGCGHGGPAMPLGFLVLLALFACAARGLRRAGDPTSS